MLIWFYITEMPRLAILEASTLKIYMKHVIFSHFMNFDTKIPIFSPF